MASSTSTVLKIEELTYDSLPSNARPIASPRPTGVTKMAKWRREMSYADVVPTVTAEITDGLRGGSTAERRHVMPANRYGRRAGRYFTMPPAAGRFDSRGFAKMRPRARNYVTRRTRVPDSGVPLGPVPPPPPGPGPFWHGRPEAFASTPTPGPGPFWHGLPEVFAGYPPSGPVPYSHGNAGPFASPPPPGTVPFSNGHPGLFAGPPPPGPRCFWYRPPEPFAGPPTRTEFMVDIRCAGQGPYAHLPMFF